MRRFYCEGCGKHSRKANATVKVIVEACLYDDDPLEIEVYHTTVTEDSGQTFTCMACGGPVVIREGRLVFEPEATNGTD